MTLIERVSEVYEDEKRTKKTSVRSWEISGMPWPREKNLPVRVRVSWCAPLYLCASHQSADMFLAVPISFKQFLQLWWHRLTH